MKACLMRVNYDPRYTTPHNVTSLQSRLAVTRDIYGAGTGTGQRQLKDTLEEAAARRKARQRLLASLGSRTPEKDLESSVGSQPSRRHRKEGWSEDEPNRSRRREEGEGRGRDKTRTDQHKEGVAAAHSSLRPSNHHGNSKSPTQKHTSERTPSTTKKKRSYGERLLKRQQSVNTFSSPTKSRYVAHSRNGGLSQDAGLHLYHRSKTMAALSEIIHKKNPALMELEKRARRQAERAIKDRKVFTILGPYHSLRQALRRRGWVEKFNNAPPPTEVTSKRRPISSDSDDDDGNDRHQAKENITPPWEEENGFYGMMSEALQGIRPTLIFAVRSIDVESRSRHQIVNHYAKANNFTTKMGLCQNLRAVPWYDTADPDDFYPRCYNLDDEEERQSYIEDFRYTACVGFLKWFVDKYDGVKVGDEEEESKTLNAIVTSMMSTTQALGNDEVTKSTLADVVTAESERPHSQLSSPADLGCPSALSDSVHVASHKHASADHCEVASDSGRKGSLPPVVPVRGMSATSCTTTTTTTAGTSDSPPGSRAGSVMGRFLYHRSGKPMKIRYYHIAVRQCENLLKIKEHEDIDILSDPEAMSDNQWDQFLTWYYIFVHEDGDFSKVTGAMVRHCKALLGKLKEHLPQYTLDGCRNVWIIKPGAKSRGRGIQCQYRLEKILAMLSDNDDKFVAQKYIERPFLVYNTKFDIRQWFLVTDWQPLTIWFYKSCYLRFCSQTFTLDNFHESIHLSNNSVQKHYNNQSQRSDKLPRDNMWTDCEFEDFLTSNGFGDVWQEKVVPGMKSALICSMLCTQELVEVRKSAFELYGADFMITDDFQPLLIEINSSPSMARNTRATCVLVDAVLEDTLKVVLDRRADKNAETGGFQCIHRQNYISDPRPIDTDLTVTGRKIRKKNYNYTPHRGPVNVHR